MRLLTAVAVTSILLASSANAATYYVSTTGNDVAAGSIDAPFRTITRASKVAKAGDVVNVRGGTYTDATSISSKGTASAPIVFRAMAGEKVILDGGALPSKTGVVTLNATDSVDFSGFEIRNSSYIGIVGWNTRNTRILDNEVHHTTRNGIYAGGDDVLASSSDTTVSGNIVHDTVLENQTHTMTGGWAGAVVVSKTDRATITNNRIYNNDGEGLISLRSNYAVIRNNEISDNFSVSLYLDNARFVTADRNLIYSTGNTRYYRNNKPAAGISVANETSTPMNPSSDNVFTNNIVVGTRYGFYYGAYESGGGLRNTKVLNNTFYGTTEEIVRVENDAHANSVFANNIFYQTGAATPKYSGAGPVTWKNNLWFGGTAGVAAGTGDLVADPRFVKAGGFTANDYKLTNLSAAIHTGIDMGEVTTDFFGVARTPASDIGAHEQSVSLGSSSQARQPLEAPANVKANAKSDSIELSWAASEGGTAYQIYRNRALVGTVSATTWTDTDVAPATNYAYAITTIDGSGNESAPSMTASVWTSAARDTQAPSTPAQLTAAVNASGVALSWERSTDDVAVTRYLIYRNDTLLTGVTGTTWTDTTTAGGTTYRYDVVAFDAAQNSSAHATTTVTTPQKQTKGRAVRH